MRRGRVGEQRLFFAESAILYGTLTVLAKAGGGGVLKLSFAEAKFL